MTDGTDTARSPAEQLSTAPVAGFSIPAAASLQERRPRTLKHGDTFAVLDQTGDIVSDAASPEGIFHCDTRHLSQLRLAIGGARPMLLSSTLRDDNATLTCDLSNPDLYEDGHLTLGHDLMHLRRSKFLWNAGCYERVAIRNFGDRPHHVRLTLDFAADFADLFEVRGTRRARRGTLHPPELAGDLVTLGYTGIDQRRRTTRLRFAPTPTRLEAGRALFEFDLEAHGKTVVFIEIQCEPAAPVPEPRAEFFASLRQARRTLRRSSARAASIETSNEIFNEAVRRAVSDLYMLITDLPSGPYPYAGIPWFSTPFGRDAMITALQTLWMDPTIARGVLAHLAANQAQHTDALADAEPGKILHEMRHGEMAELGEVPFRCYYGSVDSTPLFVMLCGAYLERTGDLAFVRRLWPNVEAALGWIDRYGDRDGDGFVEYGRRSREGLINQGWKDSLDSVFHSDGTLAHGPIALAEVQGYVYRRAAGRCGDRPAAQRLHDRVAALEHQAEDLRIRFEAEFWDDALGTYVLALDGDKRQCRVRTSNAGQVLFTGIAAAARAERVVQQLMSPRVVFRLGNPDRDVH